MPKRTNLVELPNEKVATISLLPAMLCKCKLVPASPKIFDWPSK